MHRLYIVHVVNNVILILVELSITFLIHTLWYLFAPKIILNWAFGLNGVILRIFNLSDTIPF
jgi:hypothetical protein